MATEVHGGALAPEAAENEAGAQAVSAEPVRYRNWPTVFWLSLLHAGLLATPWTFSWSAMLLVLVLGWITGGLGVSLGFHRLLTHRSLSVARPVKWALAMLGTLAGQGPVIEWVADHRKHHAFTDRPGDPHSPHDGPWWSHIFWLAWTVSAADREAHCWRWAPDLMKDPVLRWMDRLYLLWHFLLGGLLFAMGYWFGGSSLGWSFVVWGMFVRLVYVLHATFLVNSASHMWGYRNYATRDESRNLWWVALITYGEGWHNNHHAYPTAACNWHRWWEFDPTYLTIRLMRRLGLAWNVVESRQRGRRDAGQGHAA
jgi:stearoyl-CoA desaturase (delta-9 desaturase)